MADRQLPEDDVDAELTESARRASDDEYLLPEQDDTPEVRTGRRKRTVLTGIAAVLGLLLLVLAGLAGVYAWMGNSAMNQVQRQPSMMPDDPNRPPAPDQQGPMNILIMGTDSRGDIEDGQSDVLMLAHVTGDRKQVYLISFPRDMWVEVPGHGMAKINAAYAWGGMPLAVQTVEQLTGAHINHAALLDFEGFMSVIDTIGGVRVYNPIASASAGHTFPQGYLDLDGEAALAYTRERKGLPNGDLDRTGRQRDVVMAVTRKLLTREVLTNPAKLNEVLNMVAPHFVVDDGFTNGAMTSLATSMRLESGEGLRSLQAPIASFGTSADGQSIDVVGEIAMAEMSQALQEDRMGDYWAAHRNDPPVGTP